MVRLTKQTKGFKDIKWVARAAQKDCQLSNTFQLNIIHSKAGRITATDGHRLHECEAHSIPDGNWEIIKNVQGEIILEEAKDVHYPDLSLIDYNTTEMSPVVVINSYGDFDHDLALVIRALAEDETINHLYLADTLSIKEHFDVFQQGHNKALQFVNNTHRAFIMPKRI